MNHAQVSLTNDMMKNLMDFARVLDGTPTTRPPSPPPPPIIPTKLEPGILAKVHNLQSSTGQALNGHRCVVLRTVEKDEKGNDVYPKRFEIRMEDNERFGINHHSFALKECNLDILPKLILPSHGMRGSQETPASFCELLLYFKGAGPQNMRGDFQPSRIHLQGVAEKALSGLLPYTELMYLVPTQMENMAGVIALANHCVDNGLEGAKEVLFALLEGDPMYIDVFLQTITWTGYIRLQSDEANKDFDDHHRNIPPWRLTDDQVSKPYIKFMSRGPFKLLIEMSKYPQYSPALWAALKRSNNFFHLLVQRLLRLVARETLRTPDGTKLGPMARTILIQLFPDVTLSTTSPLQDKVVAKDLLARTVPRNSPVRYLTPDDDITADVINSRFLS